MSGTTPRTAPYSGLVGNPLEPPVVSVVIPVFNQAAYVVGAVDSVLDQDYPSIELIVVDDGSTDETSARLAAHPGGFRVIRQENRGAAAALNHGISASAGSLVCWLSADDLFRPGKIRRQVEAFQEDPDLGLVYTGYERIHADGARIAVIAAPKPAHRDAFISVFWRNSINGSSVMMPRAVLEACGPFDERLRADVDADMWLRLTRRHRIRCIDGILLSYRIHANTLSADDALMVASMTEVRRRRIRDGTLRSVLEASEPNPPRLLAWMAVDFAMQGLFELADEILTLSRSMGRDLRAQLVAATTIRLIPPAGRSRARAALSWPLRAALAAMRIAMGSDWR